MSSAKQQFEDPLLNKLKEIILREDREALSKIEAVLNNREELATRVVPIIEEQLDFLKEKFPREYEKAVDKRIEARLRPFKDEMVGYLYPIMGKIIRKYVTLQFQLLKEKIDSNVRSTFTFDAVKRKFRSVSLGVDESELLLMSLDTVQIEEVYVIQRDSGLLLGKASRAQTLDLSLIHI